MSVKRASTDLSRHLLCAVPQLQDPNFHRSVVFMLEHGDAGSLGLVVNNPTSTRLTEVAESLELDWRGDLDEPVRLGGPVEPVRGWVLHDQEEWDPDDRELMPGLRLTTSLESVLAAGHRVFGGEGGRYLFLLGYAGWDGGQLEAEIACGSWVVVPIQGVTCPEDGLGVSIDWLLDATPAEMWAGALRAIGVAPERLVGLSGNSSLH